ncbi:IclR family transcriptional regulator C-terminal domain-containing protein [Sphingomonas canadensis]|uniref:IclR family transcriptional regulator C-terminal domain-containing protein n=1 Tax=Sphingomonas canadensis TaxID=1219257 RepID=A0ABW3HCU7_9SPHN|nr:IclR family transcriptional regulator C-terminal domain-containing protein [Sphingomonas canadensis]MCW3837013.1 helix-turn-helix domain-containing protein [Sphingomonas canadensis]
MAIDGRLLTVIKSINELGICTVVDIHRVTGISRPAVHRIVNSLCSFGYTERVDGKSAIRLTSEILSLSAGYKPENRMAEKAAPVLSRLQNRIRWPFTFATPRDDMMIVQETTRDSNPFVFDSGRTGMHLPMLSTAMGCAYLAFCAEEDREAILEDARRRGARDEFMVAARHRIAQAAERGFALRTGGEPERTSTIAVPVVIYSTAVASLCTTFPTSAVPLDEACSKYLPELHDAAKSIAASLEN